MPLGASQLFLLSSLNFHMGEECTGGAKQYEEVKRVGVGGQDMGLLP